MKAEDVGKIIRNRRRALNLNQSMLALASGTAVRFISDLENGKANCRLGLTLQVLSSLGLQLDIHPKKEA